jgi:hypothetical protein
MKLISVLQVLWMEWRENNRTVRSVFVGIKLCCILTLRLDAEDNPRDKIAWNSSVEIITGLYQCQIPGLYSMLQFCRMLPSGKMDEVYMNLSMSFFFTTMICESTAFSK